MIIERKTLLVYVSSLLIIFLLGGCAGVKQFTKIGAKKVNVEILYGSEKKEWLEPLVNSFNESEYRLGDGSIIVVDAIPMGSIESIDGIMGGHLQPVVWSPASSVYLSIAMEAWAKDHPSELAIKVPSDLVLSPVVIAMWKPMAEALGWPDKDIGWEDIGLLAISDKGWEEFGYPEWGTFKFGHTHPEFSNSGLVSIIAEAYAGSKKQRNLHIDDLTQLETITFMKNVESSIIHYGSSTGFFAEKMFSRGPSYLSAAVLYENLIVAQEKRRISGNSSQLPVVAIYPKEGTFWTNHPYVILNAPWVSEEQKNAAIEFENYLLDKPKQLQAIDLGFRPSDPTIPLTSPLDSNHGVDIFQPKTILEIPRNEVIEGIQNLWMDIKKPVDLVVVFDTSGSMEGEKISSARSSLNQFIGLLSDRDRVQIYLFNTKIIEMTPLSDLGSKREDISLRVSAIVESGGTRLYDSVKTAYEDIQVNGNPDHIRAIIVLSDGMDTDSNITLDELVYTIKADEGEGGNSIKIFTIAFGNDADENILKKLSEITGGKNFKSDPKTIFEIYREIATFF